MAIEEISSTSNSPMTASFGPAWIEKGTISSVDLKNYTVDVVSEYTSKSLPQVQVMHPYFHTAGGEGIFFMPEVGAIVWVCHPSDDDPPFVLGFMGSFELEGAKKANLEDRAGEAKNETEELLDAFKKSISSAGSTTSSGSATKKSNAASARAGRPFLNPGDIMMQTRDRNFMILRRGGVIQIGATPTCQSIYIPVKNYLRQFAENIDWTTPAGLVTWTVKRAEDDAGGNAPCLYRMALRDKAQNDKADVQIQVGHVDSTTRYKIQIAPTGINVEDGSVSGIPVFEMDIDSTGNQTFDVKGKLEYSIKGGRDVSIVGTDKLNVVGKREVVVSGVYDESVVGVVTKKAAAITETYSGFRVVNALMHTLGPPPVEPVVLGAKLVLWLVNHVGLDQSGKKKEQISNLQNILSKKMVVPM
ncbi:MAG: hypothetical protein KAY24_20115 [Candidatus Eisenbacteria sp.]|nr:hypothetical protein [Candidatus Eisenbacteria bacterium]